MQVEMFVGQAACLKVMYAAAHEPCDIHYSLASLAVSLSKVYIYIYARHHGRDAVA